MKRILPLLLTGALILSLAACGSETGESGQSSSAAPSSSSPQAETETDSAAVAPSIDTEETVSQISDSDILIAYFTMPEDVDTEGVDAISGASIVVNGGEVMGNVEYMASIIQETVGGDLFQIETVEQYPLDHDPLVDQAAEEQDADARPELATHIDNLEQYDTIFLGYPNWWADLPMAVYSFFDEYDFSGKTIIPFNVHNGSRFSRTIQTIEELEPDATVIEDGFTVSEQTVAEAAPDVADWLAGLGY